MSQLSYTLEKATAQNFASLKQFLEEVDLPTEDLNEKIDLFYWQSPDGNAVACGGFEQYGEIGLLRSVAIRPGQQKKGTGSIWVSRLMDQASEMGMQDLYLLTTTAEGFFKKMGFENQDRESVPQAIKESEEFSSLCPSTAVLMHKKLS